MNYNSSSPLKLKPQLFTIVLVLMLALVSAVGVSQDLQNFTQFYFNPAVLNSSLIGVEGRPAMFFSYRQQWVGIKGSPAIANFSIQAPLVNRVNIGFTFTSNKQGILNTSSALFTGGYTLPISSNQSFRFGFSAGLASTVLDYDALDAAFKTSGDPTLANLVQSTIQTIGNAGFSYNGQTFHVGLSIPNLFQPTYLTSNSFGIPQLKPLESILIHASNRFYFNKGKNIFEPYAIYRFNNSLPSQIEVAGLLHLNNMIYIGGSYKANYGISALTGIRINKEAALGLSYSIQNVGTNQLNNPSFEIHLGYLFGKRNQKIPIYSFVNTELEKKQKKTALQAANDRRKVKSGLSKTNQSYSKLTTAPRYKHTDTDISQTVNEKKPVLAKVEPKTPVKKPVEKKQEPVVNKPVVVAKVEEKKPVVVNPLTNNSTLEEVIAHKQNQLDKGIPSNQNKNEIKITPTQRLVLDSASQHKEEQERLKRLEVHAEEPLLEHKDEEGTHPHAERHEFAKRGNHNSEMDLGDYVIAGVFSSEANAKKYSDGLRKLGFKDADYGFLSAHNHWYVHISESNDINVARTDRDKYRKMTIFKESWLLTVHP